MQRHQQNNIIKAINSESLFELSGSREFQLLRTCNTVQYNQYVVTDPTEGRRNTTWTPRTLPKRQCPQWHQASQRQRPNPLVNLNLRSLYLQCP